MISKCFLTFVFLLIAICPTPSICWEYCKPKIHKLLCRADTIHTVCDPTQAFDQQVMFIAEKFLGHVPITRKLKRVLLHIHNDYRNRVASGDELRNATDILKYPIASRMRELIWDNELMYVAHVHSRQVRMGHDKCRNTQRYRYSGQNLGWQGYNNYVSIIDMLTLSLKEMYLEKDLVPVPIAMAANFTPDLRQYHVGHFTAMMNDRVSRMGCAIAIGSKCKNTRVLPNKVFVWCYYLACNYDSTNIINTYVYKTDTKTPGSQCSDWNVGISTKYKHLCANTGKYFDPTVEVGKNNNTKGGRSN